MKPTAQLLLVISQNMHTSIEPRSDLDDVENQIAEVMDRLGNVVTRSELFEVMNGFGEPHMKRGYLVLNGNPFRADVVYDEITDRPRNQYLSWIIHGTVSELITVP